MRRSLTRRLGEGSGDAIALEVGAIGDLAAGLALHRLARDPLQLGLLGLLALAQALLHRHPLGSRHGSSSLGPEKPGRAVVRSPRPGGLVARLAAEAATATAALLVLGLVHLQRASPELGAVERADGVRRRARLGHLAEREAARAARLAVHDHVDRLHAAVAAKELAELVLGGGEGKVADIQFLAHFENWSSSQTQRLGATCSGLRPGTSGHKTSSGSRGVPGRKQKRAGKARAC